MFHLIRSHPRPCHAAARRTARGRRRWLLLLLVPLAGVVLTLASCSGGGPCDLPPVPVIDTEPIGSGLKLVGFALVGMAVVSVLGRLLR